MDLHQMVSTVFVSSFLCGFSLQQREVWPPLAYAQLYVRAFVPERDKQHARRHGQRCVRAFLREVITYCLCGLPPAPQQFHAGLASMVLLLQYRASPAPS